MLELKEIQRRRKHLNLTQPALAKLAGVSQSALAKIEATRMNPSFAVAKRIFEALEQLEFKESIKATDIMAKNVIFAEPQMHVERAIELMRRHNISQIPIIKKNNIIGILSETTLLERIGEKNLGNKKVEAVMEDAPPLIPGGTPVKTVSELLKHSPVVLVAEGAKIKGIISKADLLKVVK